MGGAALAIVAASCGGHAQTPKPPPARTPYLVLFERGHVFALPAKGGGTAKCTVTEVKQVGDADVSHLSCEAPYQALLIAGTWVSTPAGLYHPYVPVDEPDELTLLGEDDLLIATVPAERDHSHVVDQAQESIETFAEGSSWCVRHATTAASDKRQFAICFDGRTVTGASDLVQTGNGGKIETQRVELGQAPHDDEED